MKKHLFILLTFLIVVFTFFAQTFAVTIGIHGIQGMESKKILQREEKNKTTIPIIGMIFDQYGIQEKDYLTRIVSELGTGRIYHISLSPFGFTSQEVTDGFYDKEYNDFFEDIKNLQIKVIFRTMHEMNGGRYSRSSRPDDFKKAWRRVRTIARKTHKISLDHLLFSLSFNSQDLPTTDNRPTQDSKIRFCSEREVKNKGRCPRKADYYPGDRYVDLVGVTLYNRGRSRPDPWAKRKSPQELMTESDLLKTLEQRNKPIIIDELGTTSIDFVGDWSQDRAKEVFEQENRHKNQRLQQRQQIFEEHYLVKAVLYFNLDPTAGATKQILGQADRNIILSRYHKDYKEGIKLLTTYNNPKTINRLFKSKVKKK